MKGLEICRKYYEEYGADMIRGQFGEIESEICVGMFGSGSECFGFDDDISRDHDFEAGFRILLPDESVVDRKTAFALERAYAKLPKTFCGIERGKVSAVGGSRYGVMRTSDFLIEKVGRADGLISGNEWFTVPETMLAEATNGEIFKDDSGTFSAIRAYLSTYPQDVKLKKLAGNLLMAAQAGQYNYMRSVKRGERAGAQLCAIGFVEYVMNAVFLLNDRYRPYYKWAFRAFSTLPILSELYGPLEYLITSDNSDETAKTKAMVIEDVSGLVIEQLKVFGFTDATCGDLEKHAYSVNDRIEDPILRNAHILSAVG